MSSICLAGRRLLQLEAETCPYGTFPNSDSPACIILRVEREFWTEVASHRLHFSRSSTDRLRAVQRAAWAWNSVWLRWEIFFKNPWPAGLHCSTEWCCLAWQTQSDGAPVPWGKQHVVWQHLGQRLCGGTVTPEGNENFRSPEHSTGQLFLSQGSCCRSEHCYGWRRWGKWGRGGGWSG